MQDIPNYASKRFLLVDDETFMLGLVERILKQCQAGRIDRATDGAKALRAIRGDVDCVIADLNMKPMNGLQLLQAIRTGAGVNVPRGQPFVMLTGHGESDAVKAAVALDIHGYILKPVSIEKLVTTVEMALSRSLDIKDAAHYRAIKLPEVGKQEPGPGN